LKNFFKNKGPMKEDVSPRKLITVKFKGIDVIQYDPRFLRRQFLWKQLWIWVYFAERSFFILE